MLTFAVFIDYTASIGVKGFVVQAVDLNVKVILFNGDFLFLEYSGNRW